MVTESPTMTSTRASSMSRQVGLADPGRTAARGRRSSRDPRRTAGRSAPAARASARRPRRSAPYSRLVQLRAHAVRSCTRNTSSRGRPHVAQVDRPAVALAQRLGRSGRWPPSRPARRPPPAAARPGSWPAPGGGCGPRSCGCPTAPRPPPGRPRSICDGHLVGQRPGVADAGRAAVADQVEAQLVERLTRPGALQVVA